MIRGTSESVLASAGLQRIKQNAVFVVSEDVLLQVCLPTQLDDSETNPEYAQ